MWDHSGTRLGKRKESGRRGLSRGDPRRSEDQRNEGRDGGNNEIERAESGKFRTRGSRLSYIATWSPGGDRKVGIADSFNFSPFNTSSEFKLEFNGMLT
jgi:hypothetical protein